MVVVVVVGGLTAGKPQPGNSRRLTRSCVDQRTVPTCVFRAFIFVLAAAEPSIIWTKGLSVVQLWAASDCLNMSQHPETGPASINKPVFIHKVPLLLKRHFQWFHIDTCIDLFLWTLLNSIFSVLTGPLWAELDWRRRCLSQPIGIQQDLDWDTLGSFASFSF